MMGTWSFVTLADFAELQFFGIFFVVLHFKQIKSQFVSLANVKKNLLVSIEEVDNPGHGKRKIKNYKA